MNKVLFSAGIMITCGLTVLLAKDQEKLANAKSAIIEQDIKRLKAVLKEPLTDQEASALLDQAHQSLLSATSAVQRYGPKKCDNLVAAGLCAAFSYCLVNGLMHEFSSLLSYLAGKKSGQTGQPAGKAGKTGKRRPKTGFSQKDGIKLAMGTGIIGASSYLCAYFLNKYFAQTDAHTKLSKAYNIVKLLQNNKKGNKLAYFELRLPTEFEHLESQV